MPKDRSKPYSKSTMLKDRSKPYSKSTMPSVGEVKEWEEARCAICLEHPHNAVLLLCSSHEKGCRPYMCDTSYRHSNCLDQFRKSSPSLTPTTESDYFSHSNNIQKFEFKLPCPLCRGEISGWMVLESARSLMNSQSRSCSLESCDFVGTYPMLRAHARCEHPSVCPTKADPTRQEKWARLENETTYQDLIRLGNESMDFMELFPLEDYTSFFENFESETEWDDAIDADFEHELPFTFMEMPFTHSDLNCPFHSSVARSPDWSYIPIHDEFSPSTSGTDTTTQGYSSRRSSLDQGQGQGQGQR